MSRRAHGPASRWLYRLHRVLQKLSGGRAALHVYLFCAQPTAQAALTKLRDDPQTLVVPVEQGSRWTSSFPRPASVIAQRFAQGARCFAVLVKDRFAGHLWLVREAYEEDEVRCRYMLPPGRDSVFDFDVFVEPEFRAGRTMARLWKAGSARLREEGVLWTFSRISLFNAASIQSHERLGASHLATGAFLVLGSLQLALLSVAPYVHLGWRPGARPVVHLRVPKPLPSSAAALAPGADG
jgi:hypothetical protein